MRMSGGFGGMGSQRGMAARAERGHSTKPARETATDPNKKKTSQLLDQLPEVWALMRPRRGLLAAGMVLMAINRVSGLALPYSPKYLLHNVMIHRQTKLLPLLVGGGLFATLPSPRTRYT